MLFDPKTKKVIKFIWGVVVVFVIISMVMLYIPGLSQ